MMNINLLIKGMKENIGTNNLCYDVRSNLREAGMKGYFYSRESIKDIDHVCRSLKFKTIYRIRLSENGGTNRLYYKIRDELKLVDINIYCFIDKMDIPEISDIDDAIKESCSMRNLKK